MPEYIHLDDVSGPEGEIRKIKGDLFMRVPVGPRASAPAHGLDTVVVGGEEVIPIHRLDNAG